MKIVVALLLTFNIGLSFAQQDPQYTQYMYNMSVINPAYAGSKDDLTFGLIYRSQWTALDGGPRTGTFFGHTSINNKIGLGLSVISDQLGPVNEVNTYADFSYTINLSNGHNIALGIKAGVTFHDIGLVNLNIFDANDPFFSENINRTTPNLGTGVFYYSNNYYLAFSIPNLLNSVHLDTNVGTETQHYFLTGGYVFDVNTNLKFKPSFLIKSAFKAATSFDVNANLLLFEKFEIGASYRLDDSLSALVSFVVAPSLKIGYAYDFVSSEIDAFAPASHEIIILFDLNLPRKSQLSPRYF